MADSNSSATTRTTWKKKRNSSARLSVARQALALNRTANSNKSGSSMSVGAVDVSSHSHENDQDHNYNLSQQLDSPILQIEEDSFSTMFDSPVKKRSHVVHSTPFQTIDTDNRIKKLKDKIKYLEEQSAVLAQESADSKAKLLISKSRILELESIILEQKKRIESQDSEIINLKSCVSSKMVTDHVLYTEKPTTDSPKVRFKENNTLAVISTESNTTPYFATMEPSVSYASLTHQRDKKRRLDIFKNFLVHLSKEDAMQDSGTLLGDFLLGNPPIAQHIFQRFRNEIPFRLGASDSLDFKLALGLSWNDYRKIKCFMNKLSFDFLAPTNKAIKETSNRKVKSELKFSFISLTEKDEKVERPLLVVADLADFIEECWIDTIENGELSNDDDRFGKKIWIAIGGDNGGKTTKLTLSIINVAKPNSVHNTRLIGFYEGADKADNLRTAFAHLSDQVQRVQESLTLPYPLIDGTTEHRKIKVFLVGDTMFLSYVIGHQGPTSSFPCAFCNVTLNDLKKTGTCKLSCLNHVPKTRDIFPKKLCNSQVQYPLFAIPLENIVPPVLHIPLGLFNDIFKQIRVLCKKTDLTTEFGLPVDEFQDLMKKETSIQAFSSAILTRIDDLSNEIECVEEDLSIYRRLQGMLTSCIDNKVKPKRISKHCCSEFCFLSSPFFKQHCNNWLYCKKCPNMTHTVCSLALTQHQMSKIDPDHFECFDCRGQNSLSAILQMCIEIEKKLERQLVALKESHAANSTQSDKLKGDLEKFRGGCEQQLFSALDALGVDLKAYHSGTFVGNHIFKMLKITDEINGPDLLTQCLQCNGEYRKRFYDVLILLGKIFALTTKTGFLDDDEISDLSKYCHNLKRMMADKFPDWTTTVKLHMLTAHVPDFAKRHRSCGSFSEQGIESLHAQMNNIRRLFVMRGPGRFMPNIFHHHHLLASVKCPERFLPEKRKVSKSTSENSNDKIVCDDNNSDDRFSDDDFEVEF